MVQWVNILIIFAALCLIAYFLVLRLRKKIAEKIKEKYDYNKKYLSKISQIKNSKKSARNLINELDKTIRKFMDEYYGIEHKQEYFELKKEFAKLRNNEFEKISDKMIDLYYVEESITKKELTEVIELFRKVVFKYKIKKIDAKPKNIINKIEDKFKGQTYT